MKGLFGATARWRLALVLLLVVGGGMITFTLHGEPHRTRSSSDTPPDGRVLTTDAIPAPPAGGVAESAPGTQYAPMWIRIPAIAVSAPVDPLGLNRDGTLEVPDNFARAGWYTGRPTPGEAGPAIIVAHRSSRRGPGAFWRLPEVLPGQQVVVTRADGRRVLFVVDRLEQHRKAAFPTGAVYGPTPEAALRLITCGGPFEPALEDHYRDNVVVFARMTGWAN